MGGGGVLGVVEGVGNPVYNVLGSLSGVMLHRVFAPPRSLPVEGIFPLEFAWALTLFP